MRKIIYFKKGYAILERNNELGHLHVHPCTDGSVAQIADILEESERVKIAAVYPIRGCVAFTAKRHITNAEVIDAVSDAIAMVYDSELQVDDETAETIV